MAVLGGGLVLGGGSVLAGGTTPGGGGTGGGGTGDIEIALEGKHQTMVAVAVKYLDADGNAVWAPAQIITFDEPLIANIQGVELRYSGVGEVIPSVVADEVTTQILLNVGIGSPPADPSVAIRDAVITGNNGEASSGRIARYGDAVYVSAIGVDKEGRLGPAKLVGFHRGDAAKHQPHVHATCIRSGDTARLELLIDDPTLAVTSVQYKRREGTGSLDAVWQEAWEVPSTGVVAADSYLTRYRTITAEDGLDGELHWRVTYTNQNGSLVEVGDSINLANLRNLSKTLVIPYSSFVGAGLAYGHVGSILFDYNNVHPDTVGVDRYAYASVVVPPGCEMIEMRSTGNGALVSLLYSFGGFAFSLGDLTLSGPGIVDSAALSEQVEAIGTNGKGYTILATLNAGGDATFYASFLNWVEIDYDVPSYEFTY